ncbi:MAG: hypothetical protein ACTS46_00390 [Candidatus Hodgkinia cicadicola]
MLRNINIDRELRTFILKVLGIYSGWIATLCKIWEMSCQLFTKLLEQIVDNEEVSAIASKQSKPAEAATELNNSPVETSVCESQLPAVEQNTSAEAKVETSTNHVEASKTVEATAETTKQVSTEAKCTSAVEADEGNEVKPISTDSNLKTIKLESTSTPPVEETKPEARETTSQPAEEEHQTTSQPAVEDHKTTSQPTETMEVVSTPSEVEVVESPPSAGEEHINSSPSLEGEPNETESSDEINDFNERSELTNPPSEEEDELSSELGASDAKLIIDRLTKPKRTADCKRSSAVRDEELSEAFETETNSKVQSNKKSKKKRINLKRN